MSTLSAMTGHRWKSFFLRYMCQTQGPLAAYGLPGHLYVDITPLQQLQQSPGICPYILWAVGSREEDITPTDPAPLCSRLMSPPPLFSAFTRLCQLTPALWSSSKTLHLLLPSFPPIFLQAAVQGKGVHCNVRNGGRGGVARQRM